VIFNGKDFSHLAHKENIPREAIEAPSDYTVPKWVADMFYNGDRQSLFKMAITPNKEA